MRMVSHLRAQVSRDLQWSQSNSNSPLTRIPGILDGFGRSTILPRETREHREHLAETISREGTRHSWKFGADVLLTQIHNYFPSTFGGEYIFDPIKVDPFTFKPMIGGLELTPLRAYAHQVPHSYVQRSGPAVSHPDSNEFAAFAQDSLLRATFLPLPTVFAARGPPSQPQCRTRSRKPTDRRSLIFICARAESDTRAGCEPSQARQCAISDLRLLKPQPTRLRRSTDLFPPGSSPPP